MNNEEEFQTLLLAKLDSITSLLFILAKDPIQKIKDDLSNDSISNALLELAVGQSYSELLNQVAEKTGTSTRTVKRRLSELRSLGFLLGEKRGNEVHIRKSDLLV